VVSSITPPIDLLCEFTGPDDAAGAAAGQARAGAGARPLDWVADRKASAVCRPAAGGGACRASRLAQGWPMESVDVRTILMLVVDARALLLLRGASL
jgi:hypothetical protein